MAQSANYYGLRRGSTKSHTYSVRGGKQITKDRVEGGKNPRTLPQMIQRCIIATIGLAYAAMKFVCECSFEEITAGLQSMRTFMHENMKQIRISKADDNGFFGYAKYGESELVPGSYIISLGSLPKAIPEADIASINVADREITIDVASGLNNNIADIADAMGCKKYGDRCIIAVMYPKANGNYGFGAVRFVYAEGSTVLESFHTEVCGDIIKETPSYSTGNLTLTVRMVNALADNASTDNTYMTAFTARNLNGEWLYSKAQFDVQNAKPTLAEAIATYPIGKERFVNAGMVYDMGDDEEGGTNTGGNTGGDNGGDNGGNSGGGDDNGGGTTPPGGGGGVDQN